MRTTRILKEWMPPVNLWSRPLQELDIPEESMEIRELVSLPEKHWEIYDEWLAKGKPKLECRSIPRVEAGYLGWVPCRENPTWYEDVEYRIVELMIPECHRELYNEWMLSGKPELEFRATAAGHWTKIWTEPGWSSHVEYRIVGKSQPQKEHLTANDQYWYKKGYQQALADVRAQLDTMAGKR